MQQETLILVVGPSCAVIDVFWGFVSFVRLLMRLLASCRTVCFGAVHFFVFGQLCCNTLQLQLQERLESALLLWPWGRG